MRPWSPGAPGSRCLANVGQPGVAIRPSPDTSPDTPSSLVSDFLVSDAPFPRCPVGCPGIHLCTRGGEPGRGPHLSASRHLPRSDPDIAKLILFLDGKHPPRAPALRVRLHEAGTWTPPSPGPALPRRPPRVAPRLRHRHRLSPGHAASRRPRRRPLRSAVPASYARDRPRLPPLLEEAPPPSPVERLRPLGRGTVLPHGPQEQAGPRRWPFASPDTYGHRDTCNHSRNDTMPSLRVFLIIAELHGHAPVAGFAPRSPYPSLRLAPGAARRRAGTGRARPSAVSTEPPARPVLDEKLKQETPSPREPCVWRWPPLLKKAQSALEGVTRRGPCRRLRTFPPRLEGTQCSQRCPAAWPLRRRGSEHRGASCCTSGLTPPQS